MEALGRTYKKTRLLVLYDRPLFYRDGAVLFVIRFGLHKTQRTYTGLSLPLFRLRRAFLRAYPCDNLPTSPRHEQGLLIHIGSINSLYR